MAALSVPSGHMANRTTGGPINPLAEHFGAVPFDPHHAIDDQQLLNETIPKAYASRQTSGVISQVYRLLRSPNTWGNELFPFFFSPDPNFRIKILELDTNLIDRVPEGVPPRHITYRRREELYKLSHYSEGFEIRHQFFMDAEGKELFNTLLAQVAVDVAVTTDLDRSHALMNASIKNERLRLDRMEASNSIAEELAREKNMTGMMQKNKRAIYALDKRLRREFRFADIAPTNMVIPDGLMTFLNLATDFETTANLRGVDRARAALENGLSTAPLSFLGLTVYEEPVYRRSQNASEDINIMQREFWWARLYISVEFERPSEHPRAYGSKFRTISIHNQTDNRWESISVMDQLKNSMRFDDGGNLDSRHKDLIDSDGKPTMANTIAMKTRQAMAEGKHPSDNDDEYDLIDMFIAHKGVDTTDNTQRYKQVEVLGEMEIDYATHDQVKDFVELVTMRAGSNAQQLAALAQSAITNLRGALTMDGSPQAEAFVKATLEHNAGRERNEFGSLDLPEGQVEDTVPYGFFSAGGIQTIARSGAALNISPSIVDMAQTATSFFTSTFSTLTGLVGNGLDFGTSLINNLPLVVPTVGGHGTPLFDAVKQLRLRPSRAGMDAAMALVYGEIALHNEGNAFIDAWAPVGGFAAAGAANAGISDQQWQRAQARLHLGDGDRAMAAGLYASSALSAEARQMFFDDASAAGHAAFEAAYKQSEASRTYLQGLNMPMGRAGANRTFAVFVQHALLADGGAAWRTMPGRGAAGPLADQIGGVLSNFLNAISAAGGAVNLDDGLSNPVMAEWRAQGVDSAAAIGAPAQAGAAVGGAGEQWFNTGLRIPVRSCHHAAQAGDTSALCGLRPASHAGAPLGTTPETVHEMQYAGPRLLTGLPAVGTGGFEGEGWTAGFPAAAAGTPTGRSKAYTMRTAKGGVLTQSLLDDAAYKTWYALPATRQTLEELARKDLPVPVSCIMFNPSCRNLVSDLYYVARGIGRTGFSYVDNQISLDPHTKTWSVNLTYYSKAIVTDIRRIAPARGVFLTGYIGGETMMPITNTERYDATRGMAEEGNGDMFYLLCPWSMKYTDVVQPMDLVGRYSEARFQGRINPTTSLVETPHYPSYIYYNHVWKFYTAHAEDELRHDEHHADSRAVTTGWRASYWRYNPRAGDLSNYIEGNGHLGGLDSNHNEGARRGEPDLLTSERMHDPHFVPIM